jgi:CRISPR/Cas system-associated exonuclease Cas4 (RecB family)
MGYYQRSLPYKPGQSATYKVSRSKIDLFMQCPRCFWLDVRLGIKRPSSPPFQINKAIDELFKKEFDVYRAKGEPHPIMLDNQLKAVPMQHAKLDDWRYNFTGVTTIHKPTNLHIFGAIDDIWVNEDGEAIVVDYKATAKAGEVNLDAPWQIGYKRQMEDCMDGEMPAVGTAAMGGECEHCAYARERTKLTLKHLQKTKS